MPLPNTNCLTLAEISELTDAQRLARLAEYVAMGPTIFQSHWRTVFALIGADDPSAPGNWIAPEHPTLSDKLSAMTPGE